MSDWILDLPDEAKERTSKTSRFLRIDLGEENGLQLLAIGLAMCERPDRVLSGVEHVLCIVKSDYERGLCIRRN